MSGTEHPLRKGLEERGAGAANGGFRSQRCNRLANGWIMSQYGMFLRDMMKMVVRRKCCGIAAAAPHTLIMRNGEIAAASAKLGSFRPVRTVPARVCMSAR
eukprot:6205322-Pleurochrysis_carterae.AAC.2